MIIKLLAKSSLVAILTVAFPVSSLAQVIPDQTLGTENSSVRSINELRDHIEGGAIRGTNLFHSFEQFNVGEGRSVYFTNTDGITNIFSRITGGNLSNILGELGVTGNANLFLLNPNGIFFGSNAQLKIDASFVATTANNVIFSNSSEWSAVNPKSPVLEINIPVGVGFSSNSGEITVRGVGHRLRLADTSSLSNAINSPITGSGESPSELSNSSSQTLALIGNKVTLDGGVLTNPSGQIEVGSLENGIVEIDLSSESLAFNYERVSDFQDVTLINRALIDTSGNPGGQINIRGKNFSLSENSLVFNSNFGSSSSGNINISTSGSVYLVGVTSPSTFLNFPTIVTPGIISQTFGTGKGADIVISAGELALQNFSLITTGTYSSSSGGNITIDVEDSITVFGKPPLEGIPTFSAISSFSAASGKGGSIFLFGEDLFLREGGLILSQALLEGRGGNINVSFPNSVEVTGASLLDLSSNSFLSSTIGTTSATFGRGGNVTIETTKLKLEEGGRVNATTSGFGSAGDIVIGATELIQVDGKIPDSVGDSSFNSSQITASSEISNPSLRQLFNLPPFPAGDSGSVILNTEQLTLDNAGLISVTNQGTGDAGDIKVNASTISLENLGSIAASTASGQGGNIALNTNSLSLRNSSLISATAGGIGDGGNITIDTDFIIGFGNSDIVANAFEGQGGNITINTQAIFGLEPRAELTPLSDITASSELGIDGTVEIDAQTQLQNEVVPNAVNFLSSEDIIANSCVEKRSPQQSQFFITGTGGVPPNPYSGIYEWQIPESNSSGSHRGKPLVEAQRIFTTADGVIRLDVYPAAETGQRGTC